MREYGETYRRTGRPTHVKLNRCDGCKVYCDVDDHYTDGWADNPADANCLACLREVERDGVAAWPRIAELVIAAIERLGLLVAAYGGTREQELADALMTDERLRTALFAEGFAPLDLAGAAALLRPAAPGGRQ